MFIALVFTCMQVSLEKYDRTAPDGTAANAPAQRNVWRWWLAGRSEPENSAQRNVLHQELAENLAKNVVWRICAAENIAFRDESARARAQPAQLAAQTRPALQQQG